MVEGCPAGGILMGEGYPDDRRVPCEFLMNGKML